MPVFNAAAGQQLAQPVTAYQKGRAIESQLQTSALNRETSELQNEALKMEIAAQPAAMRAAGEKAKLAADKIRQDMAKARLDMTKTEGEIADAETARRKDAYGSIFEDIAKRVQTDKPVDLVETTRLLKGAAEMMGPKELENFNTVIDKNQDGVLNAEELSLARVMYGAGQEAAADFSLTLGAKRYDAQGNVIASNPKPTDGEGSGNTTPLTAEEKIALGIPETSFAQRGPDGKISIDDPPSQNDKGPSEKEKEIALYRSFGESQEDAVDLAYGNISVTSSTDSQGNVTVTNSRTGDASKISARAANSAGLVIPKPDEDVEISDGYVGPSWSKPVALIKPAPNITDTNIGESQSKIREIDKALQAAALVNSGDMMDAAGISNIAARGWNNVLQLASFNQLPRFFQEETDARLKVLNFNQAVRSAVIISSKGNVWEQQMVEKMLPKPDNILSDPIGEGIAFTRTLHWLANSRETDVAFLEGREPLQIPRKALGVEDDPFVAANMEEAQALAADPNNVGSFVIVNGTIYPIQEGK